MGIAKNLDARSAAAAVGILGSATLGGLYLHERGTHHNDLKTATTEVVSLKDAHIGQLRERDASLDRLMEEGEKITEEIAELRTSITEYREKLTQAESSVAEWKKKFEGVTAEKAALTEKVENLSTEVGSLKANVASIQTAWTDKWNALLGVFNPSQRRYGGDGERDGEFNRRKAWIMNTLGVDEHRAHRYAKTSQDHDSTYHPPERRERYRLDDP